MATNSNANIVVRITGKDEVTPVIKNIEGAVSNLSKTFQGLSTGNLTQSMSGLTGLSQTIQNLGSSMGSIGKGFEGLGGKITEAGGALKSFASSSAGLAVTLGAGLAIAIGAVSLGLAKLSVELMQFASSEEKSVAQTKHTLDQLGKSNEFEKTMDNIATHEANSKFESEELNKAYVQLLTTTKDTAKANDWLSLSMDIASKKGLDLYQVSKTLSKVVSGESRAGTLSTLGIDIDEEELEKFSTNSEKAKYLYTQLMETFQGSAKIERDTGAGALENIGKQIDNIKEELGLALLEGFKPLMEGLGSALMDIIGSEGFDNFTNSIGGLASSFGNVAGKSAELLANILGLSGTDELVQKIGEAFSWVGERINDVTKFLEGMGSLIEKISEKLTDLKDKFNEITEPLRKMDTSIGGGVYDEATGTITPSGITPKVTPINVTIPTVDIDQIEEVNEVLNEQTTKTEKINSTMEDLDKQISSSSSKFLSLEDSVKSLQEKLNNFSLRDSNGNISGGGFDGRSCRNYRTIERVEAGSDIVYEGPERGEAYASNTFTGTSGIQYTSIRNSAGGGILGYYDASSGQITNSPQNSVGYFSVNDALITKTGKVVEFNKDDNILAFKDDTNLKGNKTFNLTFNIYESKDSKEIMREIMKEINRVVRVG